MNVQIAKRDKELSMKQNYGKCSSRHRQIDDKKDG